MCNPSQPKVTSSTDLFVQKSLAQRKEPDCQILEAGADKRFEFWLKTRCYFLTNPSFGYLLQLYSRCYASKNLSVYQHEQQLWDRYTKVWKHKMFADL